MNSGADAVLCAGSSIALHQPLRFARTGQQLYTEGLPTDTLRATLKIDASATAMGSIIDTEPSATPASAPTGLVVRNVIFDGNVGTLGRLASCATADGCHGLVNLASAPGLIVSGNLIKNARTWSHLVLTLNYSPTTSCAGTQITGNTIGPSIAATHWDFTDGMSINCSGSASNPVQISGNTITDVSDVGIVIFAHPYIRVTNNTINASNVHMNGALAATDYIQGNGDYTGTVFSGNTINSAGTQGGFIHVGIAAGNHLWFGTLYDRSTPKFNNGGTIIGNQLNGPGFGIGLGVSGVSNFTITSNQLGGNTLAIDPSNVTSSPNIQAGTPVAAGALDGVITRTVYLKRVYKYLLGRPNPDPQGFLYWVTALYPCSADAERAATLGIMQGSESTKYVNALSPSDAANALYQTILARIPGSADSDFWARSIASSPTVAQGALDAAKGMFSSSEFQQNIGTLCPYSVTN